MIDRNLGNAERLVRFSMGLAFAGWAFSQPYLNGIEWFVVLVLFWASIFFFFSSFVARFRLR